MESIRLKSSKGLLAIFFVGTSLLSQGVKAQFFAESTGILGGEEWPRHASAEMKFGTQDYSLGMALRGAWGPLGMDFDIQKAFLRGAFAAPSSLWSLLLPLRIIGPRSWSVAPVLGFMNVDDMNTWPLGLQLYLQTGGWQLGLSSYALLGASAPTGYYSVQLERSVQTSRYYTNFLGLRLDAVAGAFSTSKKSIFLITGTRF